MTGVDEMRFEYVCRYCKKSVGTVEQAAWTYSDAVNRLGLNQLDESHRQEVIHSDADHVQVQTVCEACEQAVQMNPELLVEGHIIQ